MNTLSFIILSIIVLLVLRTIFKLITFIFNWDIKGIIGNIITMFILGLVFLYLNQDYNIHDYGKILVDYKEELVVNINKLIIFVKTLIK